MRGLKSTSSRVSLSVAIWEVEYFGLRLPLKKWQKCLWCETGHNLWWQRFSKAFFTCTGNKGNKLWFEGGSGYSQVISSRSGDTNGMTEPNKPKVVLFGGRFLVNGWLLEDRAGVWLLWHHWPVLASAWGVQTWRMLINDNLADHLLTGQKSTTGRGQKRTRHRSEACMCTASLWGCTNKSGFLFENYNHSTKSG